MLPYDKSFKPPAVVIDIKIVKPVEEREKMLRAIVDTGASLSVIPETVVDELQLIPQTSVNAKAYDGTRKEVDGYYTDIVIGENRFETIKVVTTKQEHALIGRDIINNFTLILKGKEEIFQINKED